MPSNDLIVDIQNRNGVTVVAPKGDVDLARSPTLRDFLKKTKLTRPKRIVVDLKDVDYMDSSGVATLVEALQAARKDRTELVLCNLGDRVRSIFEIARLDTVFTIKPSLDEAFLAG